MCRSAKCPHISQLGKGVARRSPVLPPCYHASSSPLSCFPSTINPAVTITTDLFIHSLPDRCITSVDHCGLAPQLKSCLLRPDTPSRDLQSSDRSLLTIPNTSLQTFGDMDFSMAAPTLWNALPIDIRNATPCGKDGFVGFPPVSVRAGGPGVVSADQCSCWARSADRTPPVRHPMRLDLYLTRTPGDVTREAHNEF
ncbi:unnamed protein product [Pleuronectes platessa]|uniref:Uncharacterized protein n=1 Tax=Pleuronectes platessa TaxID=8262 RepID=A0A9N7V3I2_PLEPL|nr:unnamed protein product [Pleuronectes platessa]